MTKKKVEKGIASSCICSLLFFCIFPLRKFTTLVGLPRNSTLCHVLVAFKWQSCPFTYLSLASWNAKSQQQQFSCFSISGAASFNVWCGLFCCFWAYFQPYKSLWGLTIAMSTKYGRTCYEWAWLCKWEQETGRPTQGESGARQTWLVLQGQQAKFYLQKVFEEKTASHLGISSSLIENVRHP